MQLRFFTIPIHGGGDIADELNRFLAGSRILSIDRQLVQDGANSAWAICVGFESAGQGRPSSAMGGTSKQGKVDYREVLNETDFAVYAHLRSLRKEIADREGLPAYALFTNEQMAEMVQRRVATEAAMREIQGIGDARMEKYADAFLQVLREAFNNPAQDAP
jgi:superfamily II DNA helicase RecQ